MADIDRPVITKSFYKSVFSDRWQVKPYHERTAEALRDTEESKKEEKDDTGAVGEFCPLWGMIWGVSW